MLRRAEQSAVLAGGAVLAEAQRALCGALNNLGGMCMQEGAPGDAGGETAAGADNGTYHAPSVAPCFVLTLCWPGTAV